MICLFQVQEELFTAKSNYEALNQQLLEELPMLLDAATNILVKCITSFASARKLLSGRITKQYLTLCEVARYNFHKIKTGIIHMCNSR